MNPEKSSSSKATDDVLRMLEIDEMSDATLVDKHTDANTPARKAEEIAAQIDKRKSSGDFDWEGSLEEGDLEEDRAAARRFAATASLAGRLEQYDALPHVEPIPKAPGNPRARLKKELDRSNPNIVSQIYHRGEEHRRGTTEVPNVTMDSFASDTIIGHDNNEQRRKMAQIETGERRAQESEKRRASLRSKESSIPTGATEPEPISAIDLRPTRDEIRPAASASEPIESGQAALSDDEAYLPDYDPAHDELEAPNNWGHTMDATDPNSGLSNNFEDVNAAAQKEIERHKRQPLLSQVENGQESPAVESAIEEMNDGSTGEAAHDSEELAELSKVFEASQKIRERVKDPGSPRYRILSLAAVELDRIEQPDNAEERVGVINQAIEMAARKAIGKSETEDTGYGYAGDTVAAVQLYIGEGLIGDDAESVSIGTTRVINSASGKVGIEGKRAMSSRTEQDIEDGESPYRNLVVIRWTRDDINHIFAFSPSKDAAVYAFVDDSMGNSWRRKIIMAGSIQGDERKDVIIGRHIPRSKKFHHEESMGGVAIKIINKEIEVLDSFDLELEEYSKRLTEILQREIGLLGDDLESSSNDSATRVKKHKESETISLEKPGNS